MCNFVLFLRFKSLFLNGYLTSLPWGIVNLGVKFFNVTSIMFALSASDLYHWTRFQISVFLLTYLHHHVCVCWWGYICRECYVLKWCLCVLSFTTYFSLVSLYVVSLMIVVYKLFENRIEQKKKKKRRVKLVFYRICTHILMTTNDKRRLSVLDT